MKYRVRIGMGGCVVRGSGSAYTEEMARLLKEKKGICRDFVIPFCLVAPSALFIP